MGSIVNVWERFFSYKSSLPLKPLGTFPPVTFFFFLILFVKLWKIHGNMLKGLGTQLRMVQTHSWWILTWWYRWLVRCVLVSCVPKHEQRPHITLKPILQTLTTRVWMVSRYHRMGLIVPILFTKSHQI